MLIIGERINASSKLVAGAINRRDEEFVANLSRAQAEAGADFIDVNAGSGFTSRSEALAAVEWLVEVVSSATDKPLAIDSDDPGIIAAALRRYQGEKVIINSVTAEPSRLETVGAMAAERGAWLVALAMGESGIPESVAERLAACEVIMTHLTRLGMQPEQVLFDPLVLPISVASTQGTVTLRTLAEIKARYPEAKTVMGLSNISFGLPQRPVINRAFLAMAANAGLDAVIVDPLDNKMMSLIKVVDMLVGKDPFCRGYTRAHRQGIIVD